MKYTKGEVIWCFETKMLNIMHTQKIMLIDDDEITLLIHSKILELYHEKIDIIAFQNAMDALHYLKNSSEKLPDIIFLDLNMPEMDGWGFLREYENLHQRTNLYILSSSVSQEDIRQSRQYKKVKDFIVKPLTKQKIENILYRF
jgi:CheY-like chemotaxis protein